MARNKPLLSVGLVLALSVVLGALAEAQAPASHPTSEDIERFLSNAKIVTMRSAGKGITNSRRATLTDGTLTHDAHVQTIDDWKLEFKTAAGTELNFRDTYKSNIAAYLLNRLLELDMVPVSIERRIRGETAALTWWVDDVMVDEGQRLKQNLTAPDTNFYGMQVHVMRVFDRLIDNSDRNLGNMLWTKDWRLWLIDHSRAFSIRDELRNPQGLQRCDRALLERLRRIDEATITRTLGEFANKSQIAALLARRDKIVAHFDALIAQRGEGAVLYSFAGR
jgi:hypothetical protein